MEIFSLYFIIGNLAFILTGLGYSMSKMLYLRTFIVLGAIMHMIYGFKGIEHHIDWLEINWAFILASINLIHLIFYFKDLYNSKRIPEKYRNIHVSHFRRITQLDFYHIMKKSEFKIYNKDVFILEKGVKNKHLYLILKGDVSVVLDGRVVSKCTAGDYIGEFSILYDEETTASIQCVSDEVECVIWSAKDISKFKQPLYETFSNCVNQNIVKKIKKHNEVG